MKPALSSARTTSYPLAGAAGSYRDLLNADQFDRATPAVLVFEAQLDYFMNALHERVEILRLRMAAP